MKQNLFRDCYGIKTKNEMRPSTIHLDISMMSNNQQLSPFDISLLTWNKGHHRIWHTCFILQAAFCQFYGRYNNLVCQYNLSLGQMLSDMFELSYQLLSHFWNTNLDYGLNRLPELELGLTVGVTGRQGMLTLLGIWSHLWCFQGSV
jgi:hypothetical protein